MNQLKCSGVTGGRSQASPQDADDVYRASAQSHGPTIGPRPRGVLAMAPRSLPRSKARPEHLSAGKVGRQKINSAGPRLGEPIQWPVFLGSRPGLLLQS